jgi:hypothetical protein
MMPATSGCGPPSRAGLLTKIRRVGPRRELTRRGTRERVSAELVGQWPANSAREQVTDAPAETEQPPAHDEALEFVRFCYRRRHAAWPELYDEMCAVASRGAFRGLGYANLVDHGISFCLGDLSKLAALTERVVREEQALQEARHAGVPMMLSAQPS